MLDRSRRALNKWWLKRGVKRRIITGSAADEQALAAWEAAYYYRKGYRLAWLSAITNIAIVAAAFIAPAFSQALTEHAKLREQKHRQRIALIAGYSAVKDAAWVLGPDGPLHKEFCARTAEISRVQKLEMDLGVQRSRSHRQESFRTEDSDPFIEDFNILIERVNEDEEDAFSMISIDLKERTSAVQRDAHCEEQADHLSSDADDLRAHLISQYRDYLKPEMYFFGIGGLVPEPIRIDGSWDDLDTQAHNIRIPYYSERVLNIPTTRPRLGRGVPDYKTK